MRLKLTTRVDNDHYSIKELFTSDLFLALNPPFPPVRLLRFDGCKKDDQVALRLNFIFFKQDWKSLITEDHTTDSEFLFVDEGLRLPFMFTYWRHRHLIRAVGDQKSEIVDDIEFKTPGWLPALLLKPALWLQFAYRKPIYRKLLNRKRDPTTA